MRFSTQSKVSAGICLMALGFETYGAAIGQIPIWAPVLLALFIPLSFWVGYRSKKWW